MQEHRCADAPSARYGIELVARQIGTVIKFKLERKGIAPDMPRARALGLQATDRDDFAVPLLVNNYLLFTMIYAILPVRGRAKPK